MASITINGKEYDSETLSETIKANLASLKFTQTEIQKTQATLAVLKTAENAYSVTIKDELDKID